MTRPAPTILVVDDNPDFLEQMKLQLEAGGFVALAAESAAQARELVASAEFDLAICDLMMEHADSGFGLAHAIKRKDPRIPVIMVTAVASEAGIAIDAASKGERAWAGADVILDKPVRYEQLVREINRLLKLGA
ncbi:MAG TPA: response regulator [Thermoanaerobaculaceae bacterium]|nr:response regulator [Thermoanaerobaculaceae bacterium]HRS15510.1 response regulator [Thermoanaerobaculaceae bacterium]